MKPDRIKLQNKLGKGRSVIGLHIGTSSISAAQVAEYKGQSTLIKTAVENINLKAGESTDQAVSSALFSVLAQFSFRHARINCTFHDPQIFVRKVMTPPMPLQELRSAIGLAIKNALPFPLDEAVLDFRLVNKAPYQGKERYDVLVAVCPVKVVERIRVLFGPKRIKMPPVSVPEKPTDNSISKSGNIKINAVIPSAVALENIIGRFPSKAGETLAVIVLGVAVTELMIYRNSHLEFFRRLPVTTDDIAKSMTGTFFSDTGETEITFSEAQDIKKEYGIPDPDTPFLINAKISSQQVFMLIRPKIEQLATEVNRAFEYYLEESHGGKVDRVLLTGEEAQLKRLDAFLSKELGLDVQRANLVKGISMLDPALISSDADADRQVLAIAAAFCHAHGINLLSKSFGKNDRSHAELNILKALAIAAVVAVIFASVFLNHTIQAKNKLANAKKKNLISQLKKAEDVLAVRRIRESRPYWGDILKVFSSMPQDIYLSELNFNKDQLHIKGMVLAEGESSKTALGNFISDLRGNILKDAHLKFSKKAEGAANKSEFEIMTTIETVK